jgi:predicted ATPase/class 3 adenylate cyclase
MVRTRKISGTLFNRGSGIAPPRFELDNNQWIPDRLSITFRNEEWGHPSMTHRQNFTFLFTDIERSSELWETHPQAMGRALAQHDSLLRDVFQEHGGHIFKTVGDAFCVAYPNTRDTVNAAVATQRALAATAWEETGPLRVRMAVHQGEAELRDNDYFGPTLNRVARVLAVGHGGQTLLTHVAAESVRETLPSEIALRDLGERRLKDLRQPERIFQLVVHDLPDNFPPLRSLEVLPNNLPAQVTSFVGREREMAEIKRLFPTTRLLTLTGPGGTGKTRLSIQIAADLLDQFPHGVWLVELSTVSDPALIPEAMINAVGIREVPDRSSMATLVEALRTRQLLLVIDNCEHLIADCAQIVSTLLRNCPQVKVIASSREALNIEGETIWALSPLSTPDFHRDEPLLDANQIAQLEAVQLFVERATAVRPEFRLTSENSTLVAKICWRLDGLPLAIELAAARVKLLPLAQILERLDDRFRLLTGGSRAALPRQQTLGALIDWSYDLLSDPERILFRRLSVFVGGRTLEMAEAVCAVDGLAHRDIFDLLNSLADKSLLVVETAPSGETRYTMLESIWDYADDKLTQYGEGALFRRRHLEFFVAFAQKAEPHLFGPDQKEWLDRLAQEQPNLNRALHTSMDEPAMIEPGLRVAGALTRYWEVRSYLTEGYEQFQELLARADGSVPPAVRAKAELGAARLSWAQDRDEEAMRHYRAAQALYETLGMKTEVALIEAYLGFTERNEGNNPQAKIHFEKARALGKALGSERVVSTALNGIGSVLASEGDFAQARLLKERCIESFQKMGDRWIVSVATGSLAKACFAAGDLKASRRYITEALAITRDLGNNWSVPYAIEAIADICAEENEVAKAVRLYGAASAHRESLALAFSPTEQISYQAAMERLRQAIPAQQFEEEWKKGKSLGFQAAVDLALER